MVALIEYYQNEDGTITIPEPLQPYMNDLSVIDGHDPVGEAAVGAGKRE
jgi:seryl-tRNA synthetase